MSCFDTYQPRQIRRRSPLKALWPLSAIVGLSLAGAAYTVDAWDQAAPASSRALPNGITFILEEGRAPFVMATAAQIQQDAGVSALLFNGPTALGAFASGAPDAPVLASRFVRPGADTAVASATPAPSLVTVASVTPFEAPLPSPNPFRLKSLEPTVVAKARTPVRSRALAANPPEEPGFLQRLFGSSEPTQTAALAYAPVETGGLGGWPSAAPSKRSVGGDKTAIYDISTMTVTLPNGQRLEAHSGLGHLLDDPRSGHLKSRGVTPPNVYNLRLRESLFHGVQAIRLLPVNESRMFGRDGILAHTYMLGPRGDSNGCVSFKDYDVFLNAFLRGEVTRIVVAENASSILALASPSR